MAPQGLTFAARGLAWTYTTITTMGKQLIMPIHSHSVVGGVLDKQAHGIIQCSYIVSDATVSG